MLYKKNIRLIKKNLHITNYKKKSVQIVAFNGGGGGVYWYFDMSNALRRYVSVFYIVLTNECYICYQQSFVFLFLLCFCFFLFFVLFWFFFCICLYYISSYFWMHRFPVNIEMGSVNLSDTVCLNDSVWIIK